MVDLLPFRQNGTLFLPLHRSGALNSWSKLPIHVGFPWWSARRFIASDFRLLTHHENPPIAAARVYPQPATCPPPHASVHAKIYSMSFPILTFTALARSGTLPPAGGGLSSWSRCSGRQLFEAVCRCGPQIGGALARSSSSPAGDAAFLSSHGGFLQLPGVATVRTACVELGVELSNPRHLISS